MNVLTLKSYRKFKHTLDYRIIVGLRLFIDQIFFENVDEKTNQKNKKFVSLFSNPISGKNIVLVGTGSLGSSMAKLVEPLGANIIGVNKKGKPVEGCSKIITIDKLDSRIESSSTSIPTSSLKSAQIHLRS